MLHNITEKQYKDTQKVIKTLTSKFSNMSAVDIEIIVFNVLPYVINNFNKDKGTFISLLYQKALWRVHTEFKNNKIKDSKIKESMMDRNDTIDNPTEAEKIRCDFYSEVKEVIKGLDNVEQNVLYLYLLGNTTTDTMSILNMSRKRVNKLKDTVFKKLRARLSDYEVM